MNNVKKSGQKKSQVKFREAFASFYASEKTAQPGMAMAVMQVKRL